MFSAVSLVTYRKTKAPLNWTPLKKCLVDHAVYVFNLKNILFVVPPLIISEEQLDQGLNLIDEGLSEN